MRSHTGDRPYKCLYCGDQFARSDLLSRHCNKCHANEKPLSNAGSRRRGPASASRATTSKQACDQCVQSSLPCDGSNPCAKCIQRKYRCTYVKFHRQTAPVGPGHNPRPLAAASPAGTPTQPVAGALPQSGPSRLSLYSHADDFSLGTQPMVIPSMAESIYSQPMDFSQIYPQPADPTASLSMGGNPDLAAAAAKYRTQPDPYRRSSVPMSLPPPELGLIPGLYTDPRQPTWITWGQENDPSFTSSPSNHSESIHDKNLQAELSQHYMGAAMLIPTTGDTTYPHPNAYTNHRDRRGSSDYNSEEGSVTSQSVPSSATSSSVHLPMEGINIHQPYSPDQQRPFIAAPHSDHAYPNRGQEGGFSSAFGLMSLDDPNAMTGIANDGAPFFSNNALRTLGTDDPNQTPMPSKQSGPQQLGNAASTPSREVEIHPGRCANPDDGNISSPVRATAKDDLRSYEAAVMARKAPTMLSLGPRARRNKPATSPQVPSIQVDTVALGFNYSPGSSRPASATSTLPPISMANWSGRLPPMHSGFSQDRSSPPSRESSISVDDSTGSGGSDREAQRPSFKRLPSHALGPPNTKRAQLSPEEAGGAMPDLASSSGVPVPVYGNGSRNDSGADVDEGNMHPRPSMSVPDRPPFILPESGYVDHGRLIGEAQQHPHRALCHPDRHIVNLSDRHRRMSAPTMTAPSLPTFTFVAPPGPGPGANR
ncbi:hypothetical protein AX15_003811 [Amanita polypyramis BW_CC]|nr:hypothetical protein AX15_003811 [Amanita polypyramis BW_CC]